VAQVAQVAQQVGLSIQQKRIGRYKPAAAACEMRMRTAFAAPSKASSTVTYLGCGPNHQETQ